MSAELQQLILLQSQQIQSLVEAIAKQAANAPPHKEQAQAAPPFRVEVYRLLCKLFPESKPEALDYDVVVTKLAEYFESRLPDPSLETVMNIIEAQDTFDYAECELDQPCISQIACAKQVISRPRPHRQSQTVNTSRPRHVKHIRQPRVQNDRVKSCPKCVLAHPRERCPLRNAVCHFCQRKGHIQTVCLRKRKNNSSAAQPMDIHVLQSQPAQKVVFKDSSTVRVGNKLVRNKPPTQPSAMRPKRNSNAVQSNVQTASEAGAVVPPAQPTSCRKQRTRAKRADFVSSASTAPIQRQCNKLFVKLRIQDKTFNFQLDTDLVCGGFQPRLPTSLSPPGQQQQPSPLPRRQPVPLMPPAQLHPGAPRVVAPAPAVPLQSPPPSELMDVDPSAGPPSQAVAVQPVLQPLSLGAPKESDTAAPCPAPTQQPSTQRQETLPLFVGPDAPSRPVPEAAPVVTGGHPDLGFQSVFPEAPRSQCWGADRGLPPTTVSAPVSSATPAARPLPRRRRSPRHYSTTVRRFGGEECYILASKHPSTFVNIVNENYIIIFGGSPMDEI
ncbi:uncharacterized protein LOC126233651 [Schistocerca nitens]|uniref:uncharacterized protein LOC126233651 n=1 Tax=Schistocerca nitens TaxID=7011 RepID=UPI0021180EB6|nr:uncharacterized protein LOC126233651 [Schistocerca nitens]